MASAKNWPVVACGTCFELIVIVIIILIPVTMVMVASLCQEFTGFTDECQLSARWLPTPGPSLPTRAVSPSISWYRPHPPINHHRLVLLFSSKTYIHSACHGGILSWLRHCSNGVRPVLEAVYHSGCCENSPWEDLILTSHAPQLLLLSLANWDLQNQILTIPVFLHSQIGAKTNLQFHACAQICCHLLLCPLISLCFRVGPCVK